MYLYKNMKIRGKIQTTVRFALPPYKRSEHSNM